MFDMHTLHTFVHELSWDNEVVCVLSVVTETLVFCLCERVPHLVRDTPAPSLTSLLFLCGRISSAALRTSDGHTVFSAAPETLLLSEPTAGTFRRRSLFPQNPPPLSQLFPNVGLFSFWFHIRGCSTGFVLFCLASVT